MDDPNQIKPEVAVRGVKQLWDFITTVVREPDDRAAACAELAEFFQEQELEHQSPEETV